MGFTGFHCVLAGVVEEYLVLPSFYWIVGAICGVGRPVVRPRSAGAPFTDGDGRRTQQPSTVGRFFLPSSAEPAPNVKGRPARSIRNSIIFLSMDH